MAAELFHTEWRTDRHDEYKSRFKQFLRKRLKKGGGGIISHSMQLQMRHLFSGPLTTRDFSNSLRSPSEARICALTKRRNRLWEAARFITSNECVSRDIRDCSRPQRRHKKKKKLQCIIALEVVSVPPSYDINRSPLLCYRLRAMKNNNGKSVDSDDDFTDDESSSLCSNG